MSAQTVPLNVTTWGDPEGPVCACLHGITGNASSWTSIGPLLADRGFRVVAPDLRGHGESPKAPDGYDTATLLADLRGALPAAVAVLVGHSFGGYLAQRAVLDGVLRPAAMVLEDPVSYQPDDALASAMLEWDRLNLPRDVERMLSSNPRWTRTDAAAKILSLEQVDWDGARAAFAGNAPWDLRADAGEIAVQLPTRWVLPPTTRFCAPADVDALTATVSPGQVIVVPGAGHSIHRDDPELFVAVIEELYRSVAS